MQEISIEEKKKREGLKTQRNLLFEEYLKHPMDTTLSLEIKLIDDQLAEDTKPTKRNSRLGS